MPVHGLVVEFLPFQYLPRHRRARQPLRLEPIKHKVTMRRHALNQPHRRIITHPDIPEREKRQIRMVTELLYHPLGPQVRHERPVDGPLCNRLERLPRRAGKFFLHPVPLLALLVVIPEHLFRRQHDPTFSFQALEVLHHFFPQPMPSHCQPVPGILEPREKMKSRLDWRKVRVIVSHRRVH